MPNINKFNPIEQASSLTKKELRTYYGISATTFWRMFKKVPGLAERVGKRNILFREEFMQFVNYYGEGVRVKTFLR